MEANITIVKDRYAFSDRLVNGATTPDKKGHALGRRGSRADLHGKVRRTASLQCVMSDFLTFTTH